jgi:hypothetical protein
MAVTCGSPGRRARNRRPRGLVLPAEALPIASATVFTGTASNLAFPVWPSVAWSGEVWRRLFVHPRALSYTE